MTTQEQITRIRVEYTKGESLRFTGHLDLQRLWERLLRRSDLPIRYSQGFHRRARLNLASALPLGFVSDVELLDFWMDEPWDLDQVKHALETTAPPGLCINAVKDVPLSEDALQSQMYASRFDVRFFDTQDRSELEEKVQALMDEDVLIRTRRKKTYDLKPLILSLEVVQRRNQEVELVMRLLAEPGQTGRPDEVLDALGFQNTEYLVKRTQILLNKGCPDS